MEAVVPTKQQSGIRDAVQGYSSNSQRDFLSKVEEISHPRGTTGKMADVAAFYLDKVLHWKKTRRKGEKRFFVRRALEITGRNPEDAERYDVWQIRGLYPAAKELIYERAAANGCEMVALKQGGRAVVITDKAKMNLARTFYDAAIKRAGRENVLLINIDDAKYGKRPFVGRNSALETELVAFNPTASFYMAENRKGEIEFRIPLIDFLTGHIESVKLDCAHAHSPGLTSWMMADGMLTDHGKIARLTLALMDVLSQAEHIRVTSPAGTDITLSFNHHKWVADHMIPRGSFGNLPYGEIYTCPEGASGKMVVDGELGDYFEEYGELDKTPVEIRVGPDGRAKKVSCANKRLEKELWKYLQQGENADRVGELGIPTNMDLKAFIRNLLQDEKAAVHIAFGDTMKEETGADWKAKTHVDGLMRNCTLDVSVRGGGTIRIMEHGKFTEAIMRRVEELRSAL